MHGVYGKAVAAALAVVFASLSGHAQEFELNVNTVLTASDPLYKGLERFANGVKERTEGRMTVQIFTDSGLGTDEEVLEQMDAGLNVATVSDSGRLAEQVPEFAVLSAPYLFETYDQMRTFVTSDVFNEWTQKLADTAGRQILSFNWYQGDRNMLTNKPISAPDDLNGLRVRTIGAKIWQVTIKEMGAEPLSLPWSEVGAALQAGAIDGAEAQTPAVYGAQLHKTVSHITKTRHIALLSGLITSHSWYEGLPEDIRTILTEEALAGGDVASSGTIESIAQFEKEMSEQGLTITDVDTGPFKEATADVYDELGLQEVRAQVNQVIGR